jgi:lysophospholipase
MDIPKVKLTPRSRLAAAAALGAALIAITVVLLGPAVRDDRDPFADSRPPPGLAERFYPPENWSWGLIQIGDAPAQRYGVGAPAVTTRADVLILPDYGESAETWFETARDLEGAGYAVWVLEGVGQGGSGRLGGRRDLGDVKSFDADIAATRMLIEAVIRPQPRRPLILLGKGVGSFVAARAVEAGARPAALILSGPDCGGGLPAGTLVQIGLGGVRAPGGEAWRRSGADDFAAHRTHDAWRGAVTHAWQVLNPDLRLGGPSLEWRAALADLQATTVADTARILVPSLVLQAQGQRGCLQPSGATRHAFPGAGPAMELEDDAHRGAWLAAVRAFVAAAAARADPAASGRVP